ncbi:RodZ domain-containing protein [Mesobacterium pallidum]|uniref:RodZ domain-containing protein n=1 Tax=Mesobacterium pallidum TaxID=2872037 RepID=UPI001EE2337C|nr:RodZ domain-containing protein [Mesobacterium pallidum]
MIGRWTSKPPSAETEDVKPLGFDDFDLRLGDVMRGERATMGKSLLDVQRELKIKASYIAAIENCDPTAFDTPGFIAGYVRSYARYLNMDPDIAFECFCAESGFAVAHGMSAEASSIKKSLRHEPVRAPGQRDLFADAKTPFIPASESPFANIEPRAIGSLLVLAALIGGIGYGGWSVLREVQRVQLAPVDQTPVVLSDLDPLDGASGGQPEIASAQTLQTPSAEALDRLYRPEALDVPVLVARDGPISTLDPSTMGSFADATPRVASRPLPPGLETPGAVAAGPQDPAVSALDTAVAEALLPQVVAQDGPELALFAVRPAWVRVRAADGTVIFEKILDAGEEYVLPQTELPPTLHAGMSGSVYFAVNGDLYGPAGAGTSTARNVELSIASLTDSYGLADLTQDAQLRKVIAELETPVQQ